MMQSRTVWFTLFLVLLATALVVRMGRAPVDDETAGQARLEAGQESADEAGNHGRTKRPQEMAESMVAVPLALMPMMNLPVFEEDTGNLQGGFLTAFQFTRTEKTELRKLLKRLLTEFGEIELQNAKHVSKDGDSFIRLNPCHEAAVPVFQQLIESSAKAFGEGRSKAIAILLEEQLREGGKTPIEISFVTLDDGRVLLSKRILSESGVVVSDNESQYLQSPDFHGLARWKHLNKLIGLDDGADQRLNNLPSEN